MKKLIKILIFLIIIMLFISITLYQYISEKSDVAKKIGALWTGAPISTYNYAAIINNFEYYKSFLMKEDYESAYKFLPYEYRLYKSYENFVEDTKKINYDEIIVSSIVRRTENLYSIILLNKNNETSLEHVIIFNEENTSFTITPESFIEYKEFNEKIKKKKVQYELISTVNYVDKYVANIKITNLNKKDSIKISNIELVVNNVKHIAGNIGELVLNPEEVKDVCIEFETYIDFPNKIEITRYIEKKDKTETYTFEIIE